MIIGVGIDIVLVATVEEAMKRYTPSVYLAEFCTEREIQYCIGAANSAQRAAARFAAKEAATKALSTGWINEIDITDFEISNETSGEPKLLVHGRALEILKQRNFSRSWVSLSHTKDYAVAQVIFES